MGWRPGAPGAGVPSLSCVPVRETSMTSTRCHSRLPQRLRAHVSLLHHYTRASDPLLPKVFLPLFQGCIEILLPPARSSALPSPLRPWRWPEAPAASPGPNRRARVQIGGDRRPTGRQPATNGSRTTSGAPGCSLDRGLLVRGPGEVRGPGYIPAPRRAPASELPGSPTSLPS